MRRRSGAAAAGRDESADWAGQSVGHAAAAAAAGGKTAGAVSVDRAGALAALDARKHILLVKLSAEGLPVHKSLRHKDAGRWVVGTNVRWCHTEQHSQMLASTCNSVALVWNATRNHPIYALREHKRSVNAVCWHPSDGTIATCSADSYIHVWDIRTPPRRPDMSFCAWTSGATCIEWSLGDENVLASSHDNEVRLWDRRKGTLSQPTAFITAHRHNVRSLAWRPGMPKALLTLGQDGAVKLWDTDESRECKADLEKQIPYSVQLASWAPFGDGLVTAGNSGETTLWSLPQHSGGSRWFDDPAAVDLTHVATLSLHEQGRQQKLRDFSWRTQTPSNPYQLCSLSVTGELRTQPIMDEWMAICHVDNKPSQPSERHQASTDAHSKDRTSDRHPSDREELKETVQWELDALHEIAVLAGRLKFDSYSESRDWLTARLRIEARKPMQTQNSRTSCSADAGYIVIDMSFPDNYPVHRVPKIAFDTSALLGVSDSVMSSLRSALEKNVAEVANASVAKESLCMRNCVERAVQILDGPLGTDKPGDHSDGDGDLKAANADQRERKGYTPCPVLSAGVFSGPGYFVTFNNGLPFVAAGQRMTSDNSASGTSRMRSPSSSRSPLPRTQSHPPQQISGTSSPEDSTTMMSPATHPSASGIMAATMKREYRSFLQELGRPLQDASKPNLSALIVGGVTTDHSSTASEYDVPPTPERLSMSSESSAGFPYQDSHSSLARASSRGAGHRLDALSTWKWNAVNVVDRSFIDTKLACKYIETLSDVDCPPRECCKRNAVHAENNGLAEVAQTWVLLALALGSLLHKTDVCESHEQAAHRLSCWKVHPLGQGFVSEILTRLMHHGDMQTVAAISCVLHDAEAEVEVESLRLAGSQSRSKMIQFQVLPHDLRQQCDNFMEEYAMLLRCRGLPLLSAAVRTKRWKAEVSAFDAFTDGSSRREPRIVDGSPAGAGAIGRPRIQTCGVCNLPVRGLGNTCLACGHIGHLKCLRGWFLDAGMSCCPVGCGCHCCSYIVAR